MRIVSVNSHFQEGLGYQDYNLAKTWTELGHEVILVASDLHFKFPNYAETVEKTIGPRQQEPGEYRTDFGARLIRLKSSYEVGYLVGMLGLVDTVASLKPDLIVSHVLLSPNTVQLARARKLADVPLVVDDHTTSNVTTKGSLKRLVVQNLARVFVPQIERRARKIVAISSSVVEHLTDLGIARDKIELIGLGTDISTFYPDAAASAKTRDELGIEPTTTLLLYTGKVIREKHVQNLIQSASELTDANDRRPVVLVLGNGDAAYLEELRVLAKAVDVDTVFLPAVGPEALRAYYSAADVAVWPAHTTISTLDANACGTVTVCSDLMQERSDGTNGLLVADADPKDLTLKLREVLARRADYDPRGFIERKFSWPTIAKAFLA